MILTDFQQVCEQIYGQPLDWFFDEWIYHAGYPSLTYSWKNEYQADDRFTARVFIHQDSPVFQMPVDVRILYAGSLLDTTVWIRNFREEFDLALPDSVQNIELDPDGWVLMADSLEALPFLPDTGIVWLNAGYPNPFHETISFEYYIPHTSADGRISIYNLKGQMITLLAEYMEAGWHRIEWNGRDAAGKQMASGLYIFNLEDSGTHLVRRMLLIR
jgi:aminopeptidase N